MDKIYPTPPVAQVAGIAGIKPVTHPGIGQVNKNRNSQIAGDYSKGMPISSPAFKNMGLGKGNIVPADARQSVLEDVFDEKTLKRMGVIECSTCASRTYQDGSDDSSVSFQAPTHLTPGQAESAVISHEMEHVVNEQAYAREEGKEVIGQSVQIFRDVCPECGISYVSGGVTKTTTVGKSNPYEDVMKNNTAGHLVDLLL